MKLARLFAVLVGLVGATSCGLLGGDQIKWEKKSQGIKDPRWIYCEDPDAPFTQCYEVISKRKPTKHPDRPINVANLGSTDEWENRFAGLDSDLQYIAIAGYLRDYRRNTYLRIYSSKRGRDDRTVITVLKKTCSDRIDLPAFFDPSQQDALFLEGFEGFGILPEGRCLLTESDKICLPSDAEITEVMGNPCYLRMALVPAAS